jgi:hypothetical protein
VVSAPAMGAHLTGERFTAADENRRLQGRGPRSRPAFCYVCSAGFRVGQPPPVITAVRARGAWFPTPRLYYNIPMDETVGGVPVTEDQINGWQQQATAGLDVEGLRQRGRPRLGKSGESPVIPVRMDEDLLAALTERAERDGVTRSEAVREAVRAWTHAV